MNVFKELYQNRKLIWKLSKNDFRNKFAGAYFGIIWAFIQPMVTVAVYFVVFQLGLRVQPAATGYPYICWLVSGIIPWFFFSDALPSASNCLLEYSYLVKKVVFKISVLPIVKVISSLFVPVSKEYLGYLDYRVLALLFCLMFLVAGFRKQGVFRYLGRILTGHAGNEMQLEMVLVFLCFFFSMIITNDVALITFVPFTIEILGSIHKEKHLIPVIVLQTIAANLGSMLTPIGNPQNLYLYSVSAFSYAAIGGSILLSFTGDPAFQRMEGAGNQTGFCKCSAGERGHPDGENKAPSSGNIVFGLYGYGFKDSSLWNQFSCCSDRWNDCLPGSVCAGGLFPARNICRILHLCWQRAENSFGKPVDWKCDGGKRILVVHWLFPDHQQCSGYHAAFWIYDRI